MEGRGAGLTNGESVPVGEAGSAAPAPEATAFLNEKRLRDLIAERPHLLPGVERPTAVAKEVRVPRVGAADVVVVDDEGQITIVECKLAANPEIRRWVIGQVFSYAAGLWKLDYVEFERRLLARGTRLTQPFEEDSDWEEVTFRAAVSQNLAAGAFRLIIAVDEITAELKRTVVFLNSHTLPEVRLLALELRGGDAGVEPVVFGEDSGEVGPPSIRRPRGRERLLTAIRERSGDSAADVATDVLEWAESRPLQLDIDYARKSAAIKMPGGTLLRIAADGEIRVSLHRLAARDDWDDHRIAKLAKQLERLGLRHDQDRPRAPLESLAGESKRNDFLGLMDQVLEALPR